MVLKIRELSAELQEAAQHELHEEAGRRGADVEHIRDWLSKQPHIKANPDDQTLISFLRGCKFSLERTKEKLDMYYTMHTAVPELFGERNLKQSRSIREILDSGFYFPLPECDPQGRRVYIMRAGLNDPSKITMEEMFKVSFMMMDVMMREDDCAVVKGIVEIVDMAAMTLAHAAQMINPSLVKKVAVCSEEAFPIRPKGMNFIHTPPMFDTMFNLYSSFSKEKIRKRLHVHGKNFESLYEKVPQRILPAEYGGQAGTIKEINDAWISKVERYSSWFLSDAKCGVDESKRPGKPKTHQDLFGLEGSFRQLTVD